MKQTNLFDDEGQYVCKASQQKGFESITKFWIERHRVYLRRYVQDQPKPWTSDPALRNYRFCNIYRELDTVSQWIIKNVIKPYADNDNLWFMLAVSRLINWPETLQDLKTDGSWPVTSFKPDKMYKTLKERKERKEKIITGAYIVNSVFPADANPKDSSKIGYIPYCGLAGLWDKRKELEQAAHSSMEDFVNTMTKCHGWGAFMAYQVAVDLSYSKKWLGKAPDINTFTSPGPGTTRGMNRILFGSKTVKLKGKELNAPMQNLRKEMNKLARVMVPKKLWTDDFKTGFAELSLSNVSNCLCETDKYFRIVSGEGEPRSRYAGSN